MQVKDIPEGIHFLLGLQDIIQDEPVLAESRDLIYAPSWFRSDNSSILEEDPDMVDHMNNEDIAALYFCVPEELNIISLYLPLYDDEVIADAMIYMYEIAEHQYTEIFFLADNL